MIEQVRERLMKVLQRQWWQGLVLQQQLQKTELEQERRLQGLKKPWEQQLVVSRQLGKQKLRRLGCLTVQAQQ